MIWGIGVHIATSFSILNNLYVSYIYLYGKVGGTSFYIKYLVIGGEKGAFICPESMAINSTSFFSSLTFNLPSQDTHTPIDFAISNKDLQKSVCVCVYACECVS